MSHWLSACSLFGRLTPCSCARLRIPYYIRLFARTCYLANNFVCVLPCVDQYCFDDIIVCRLGVYNACTRSCGTCICQVFYIAMCAYSFGILLSLTVWFYHTVLYGVISNPQWLVSACIYLLRELIFGVNATVFFHALRSVSVSHWRDVRAALIWSVSVGSGWFFAQYLLQSEYSWSAAVFFAASFSAADLYVICSQSYILV